MSFVSIKIDSQNFFAIDWDKSDSRIAKFAICFPLSTREFTWHIFSKSDSEDGKNIVNMGIFLIVAISFKKSIISPD